MIEIKNLTKVFHSKDRDVIALNEINLQVEEPNFVLIKGPSGCGKSTLLFSIAGMLRPSSGEIILNGKNIYGYSEKELLRFRARYIGFVYQSYYLIPYLDVLDNIMLVNHSCGKVVTETEVVELAKQFKLEHRLHHKPSELSVGEKQRVAFMRAIVVKPKLLLADEPTGNLDPENTQIIMNAFLDFRKHGGTVIMVSHGNEADEYADIMVEMKEGKLAKA